MEKKKTFLSTVIIIIAIAIGLFVAFRLAMWLFRGLLFGFGGFLIGLILGIVWMKRRHSRKQQEE
jgi:membrane associated rhomboid family serine protease